MPLNRQDLVSSSINLLRKALLALQADQQAVDFLDGQEIKRTLDGTNDQTISQLQIILLQLSCQLDEYLACNESPPSWEKSQSSTEDTLTALEEENCVDDDEPVDGYKNSQTDLLLIDLGEQAIQSVQREEKQSASDEIFSTRDNEALDTTFSLDNDESISEPFSPMPVEANKDAEKVEVEQKPLWRASSVPKPVWKGPSIQDPRNLLLSLSLDGDSYRSLEEAGSPSSSGLFLQSHRGSVNGVGRRSEFRCRIDLTQSFYGKCRSYFAHDFYDYGEKPYSLRAVLQNYSSSTDNASVKKSPYIGFELRAMADQHEPITNHPEKPGQRPYRTYSILFPFQKGCRLDTGRLPIIKKYRWREASSVSTEQLPTDLVKILGRREEPRYLSKTLCLEWECDASFLTARTNGNGLQSPEETIAWPAVSCAALLFLKVSRWGGCIRVFLYIDDEEELEYWKTQGLPAFFRA